MTSFLFYWAKKTYSHIKRKIMGKIRSKRAIQATIDHPTWATAQNLRDTGVVGHYHAPEIYVSRIIDLQPEYFTEYSNEFNEDLDRDTYSAYRENQNEEISS